MMRGMTVFRQLYNVSKLWDLERKDINGRPMRPPSYLKALLTPLLLDEDFYFCDFEIAPTVRAYIRKHPEILKLTPPAHLVMYFRIVGGLKGILSRTATGVNLYQLAREMAKLRGISQV